MHLKWVEVSRGALRHNLGELRRIVPAGTALMAVVKSNAYGHGLREVAGVADASGVDVFGVNELDEGLALRGAGIGKPVLVMGAIPPARLVEAARAGLSAVVYTPATVAAAAAAAAAAGRPMGLHVKLETGLNRQGVEADALLPLAEAIAASPHLVLEGLSTHFANIEDTTDHGFARLQLERFREGLARLAGRGLRPRFAHCACTAAALVMDETAFDLVRVGIGMYGLWPSKETQLSVYMRGDGRRVTLRPAMAVKTRLVQVREVPKGAPIGYGCTEVSTHAARIGILPVGYFDGLDRGLSNQGQVLVRGQRTHIRGRVCMNMTMVDVTHIEGAAVGDEVVLLGSQGRETLAAEFLAGQLGTINYEVVTRIGAHLPRLLVE